MRIGKLVAGLGVGGLSLVLMGCSGLQVDVSVNKPDATTAVAQPAPEPSVVTVTAPAPVTVTSTQAAPPAPAPPATTAVQTAGSGRVPESGNYAGWAYQRDANGVRLDNDYLIEMVFSAAGSTVRYPELSCAGNLVPNGFNNGKRVYTEVITSGNCDNNGTWEVDVQSDYHLEATYFPLSGRYLVTAELDR